MIVCTNLRSKPAPIASSSCIFFFQVFIDLPGGTHPGTSTSQVSKDLCFIPQHIPKLPQPLCSQHSIQLPQWKVDFSFLDCSIPFNFWFIEFNYTFSICYKIFTNYFYYCILIVSRWADGTCFFMPTLLLSKLLLPFLPTSSISLTYFILAVPCASIWENTHA